MLRAIYFRLTEVGKRIQQAITYLYSKKAENQRCKHKRDVLLQSMEVLSIHSISQVEDSNRLDSRNLFWQSSVLGRPTNTVTLPS
jgi:hypothetical protein